ncbi:MAG TPA: ATP-binding protein, partial [Bdellovibrionota bacterium]|nr:ATP-binding protein [Bdellovibrionota bacterium]
IRQVLANLLGNAIKFTSHGQVGISVSILASAPERVTLKLEVTDSGIGISREGLSRVFGRFSQVDASTSRRFGGTGLGLSICKNLVAMMGGEIGVQTEESQGSVFWFTLPLERSKARKAIEEAPRVHPLEVVARERGLSVLLADDNETNCRIARAMLEKRGFKVEQVADGGEALAALERSRFDVVLMDCHMPGIDGFEATRLIRSGRVPAAAGIPIVAMTADALVGDRDRCLQAGMDEYVSKPVRAHALLDAIQRALEAPAKRRAG